MHPTLFSLSPFHNKFPMSLSYEKNKDLSPLSYHPYFKSQSAFISSLYYPFTLQSCCCLIYSIRTIHSTTEFPNNYTLIFVLRWSQPSFERYLLHLVIFLPTRLFFLFSSDTSLTCLLLKCYVYKDSVFLFKICT